MGVASLVMGIVALLLGMLGFVPAIGVVSLLAPVLSLFGCVLGGVGISRAKQEGVGSGMAVGGLVINIVALIITLPIALTCGACNALCAAGAIMGRPDGGVRWERTDGGAYIWQGGSGAPTYAPGYPAPTPPPTPMMPMQPAPPGAPAPAFPPPPMPTPGGLPPTDPTLAPPTPSPMPPTPPVAPAPAPTTSAPVLGPRHRRTSGLARGGDRQGAVGPESPVERAAARVRSAAGTGRRADPTAAGF